MVIASNRRRQRPTSLRFSEPAGRHSRLERHDRTPDRNRGARRAQELPHADSQVETLKKRALHPFKATEFTDLRARDDVSLEVAAGEFFGIAGRNGSGKTTLLKLLASVYGADRGTIRIGGRVAPFIELGYSIPRR
jgi:ABC-type glutathione transport system ATPase component